MGSLSSYPDWIGYWQREHFRTYDLFSSGCHHNLPKRLEVNLDDYYCTLALTGTSWGVEEPVRIRKVSHKDAVTFRMDFATPALILPAIYLCRSMGSGSCRPDASGI